MATSTEIHEISARRKLTRHHELRFIMRFQVSALTCNVADMGIAEAASEAASCLHVVVERGVVAIVCQIRARSLGAVFEPDTGYG